MQGPTPACLGQTYIKKLETFGGKMGDRQICYAGKVLYGSVKGKLARVCHLAAMWLCDLHAPLTHPGRNLSAQAACSRHEQPLESRRVGQAQAREEGETMLRGDCSAFGSEGVQGRLQTTRVRVHD